MSQMIQKKIPKNQTYNGDYLVHYGVPGMKWGVRKRPVSSSSGRSKTTKKVSNKKSIFSKLKSKKLAKVRQKNQDRREKERNKKVAQENTKAMNKSVKSMTNAELDRNIARLQKEKLYKDLSNNTRKTGERFVKDVLKTAGKAVAIEATKNILAYTINTASGQKLANTSIKDNKNKSNDSKLDQYVKSLSDEDLDKKVSRLTKENKYKNLRKNS